MPTRVKKNGLTGLSRLRRDDVDVEVIPHSGMIVCSAMWKGFRESRKYMGYTKKEAVSIFIEEVCV